MLWYEKIWYGNARFAPLLVPFSYLYQMAMVLRRSLYRLGLFHQDGVSVPVIVVGNLTVGGTGKTPFVIALAKWLEEQGERPGIVTRGYGGRSKHYPVLLSEQSDLAEVGDEALLIARQTGCPVMVDPRRVRAAQALVAQTDCTIVISDDGLQHTQLARDIEILLVDGRRRFGNELLLPAGPLREPLTRIQQVDFVVSKGQAMPDEYSMEFHYGEITNLRDPSLKLSPTSNPQLAFAFAGIGNPQLFYEQLDHLGFSLRKHSFPDHYQFTGTDFAFTDSVPVIMTEKDAVKCTAFAQSNWWYLPITATLPTGFWQAFTKRLQEVKEKKSEKALGSVEAV
jgi:tetraacyldisaccharide 4'-kinase